MPSRESLVQMAIWEKIGTVVFKNGYCFTKPRLQFLKGSLNHLDSFSLEVLEQGPQVCRGLDAEVLGGVAPGLVHGRLGLRSTEALENHKQH